MIIKGFSSISNSKPNTLTWSKENLDYWDNIQASVVICPRLSMSSIHEKITFIYVDNPRLVFTKIINKFFQEVFVPGIMATSKIGENCNISKDVYIGNNVIIDDNVEILSGTVIHNNVRIYNNCSIGQNCIIHDGAVIGGDGYGFERDIDGHFIKIPHIGGVRIYNDVEIGSYTCVNRGTLDDTVILENTKINNLTHIGHNCKIGKSTYIGQRVSISGSVKIGDFSWIAPGSTIKNQLTIDDNSTIGLGSVVIRNVKKFETVAGVPAKPITKK